MQPTAWGNSWGNLFKPDPPEVRPLETWTETEWRIKADSPGHPDGGRDCCVDGVRCGEGRTVWYEDVVTGTRLMGRRVGPPGGSRGG